MSNPTANKCQPTERKTPFIWLDLEIDEWNLTDAEVRLYVHIARRCGRGGRFWESIEAAAERLGWGRTKYCEVISSLREKGLIYEIDAPKNIHHKSKAYSLTEPTEWIGCKRCDTIRHSGSAEVVYSPPERTQEPVYSPPERTQEPVYSPPERTQPGTLEELDPKKKEKDPKKRKGSGTPPPPIRSRRSVDRVTQPANASTDLTDLASEWSDWASERVPRLSVDLNAWTMALAELRKKKGLTVEQLKAVFWFIKQDSFWCSNAISPIGLMKKSKSNGLPKIDNILASMRNSKAVQREALHAECDFSIKF